jgi:hypothetical protein
MKNVGLREKCELIFSSLNEIPKIENSDLLEDMGFEGRVSRDRGTECLLRALA